MTKTEKPLHLILDFNDMVLTISYNIDDCIKESRFWMPWKNVERVSNFLNVNKIRQVDNKKVFGILLASGIVQVRS